MITHTRVSKAFFILLVGGALIGVLLLRFSPFSFEKDTDVFEGTITIDGKGIPVSIADTETERAQGLSGTTALQKGSGKLFIFERPAKYGFWMKDMQYPLDIVWIGSGFTVVDVIENILPESYPSVFYPKHEALFVVEVNAFEAKKLGFIPGAVLSITKK